MKRSSRGQFNAACQQSSGELRNTTKKPVSVPRIELELLKCVNAPTNPSFSLVICLLFLLFCCKVIVLIYLHCDVSPLLFLGLSYADRLNNKQQTASARLTQAVLHSVYRLRTLAIFRLIVILSFNDTYNFQL
jgi:hypothetical protein